MTNRTLHRARRRRLGLPIAILAGGLGLAGCRESAPDDLILQTPTTDALVFVHPTTRGFQLPAMDDFYLWNTVGNPFETTITAAHLVGAGVLEDHPGLKIVLAHGGGAIVALRGRLGPGTFELGRLWLAHLTAAPRCRAAGSA